MTQEEQVSSLIQALRRCYRFLHHRAGGGRISQIRVLRELRHHGDMPQKTLQEHMDVSQSTLSDLVKKLEDQGMVSKTVCPEDRRKLLLSLTQAGREQLEEKDAVDLQQNIGFMQVLTGQEQQELLRLLNKLDASWSAQYPRKGMEKK